MWGFTLNSKSGTMDTKEFYELVHERPSVFADSIFEIIGADLPCYLDPPTCIPLTLTCVGLVLQMLKTMASWTLVSL